MEEVKKALTPFDFIASISNNKGDLLDGVIAAPSIENPLSVEKQYNAFMVNRGLSQFHDCVMIANEMNQYAFLPARMQYDFLRKLTRPKKRFSKWAKAEKDSEDVRAIMETYNYNRERALEVIDLLTDDQIADMRKRLDKGGR